MPNSTATNRRFTRLALILMIAVGLAFASGPISPIDVAAQDASGRVCGNHTLRGDYGLLASGIRGPEQFNATGMWTFDGTGNFTQAAGANLHGLFAGNSTSQVDMPGTYTVNANCTGTMALFTPDLPFPIEYAIAIVDNASEIKGIVTSPAISVTNVSLTRK
jgi:hypothetical protein